MRPGLLTSGVAYLVFQRTCALEPENRGHTDFGAFLLMKVFEERIKMSTAWDGGQGRNGLAVLALRAHYVRLSALRASVEPPTRGFSVN
jgi:hypothetical protein